MTDGGEDELMGFAPALFHDAMEALRPDPPEPDPANKQRNKAPDDAED